VQCIVALIGLPVCVQESLLSHVSSAARRVNTDGRVWVSGVDGSRKANVRERVKPAITRLFKQGPLRRSNTEGV